MKPCLFCGVVNAKLTKEHVFPKWLDRALRPPYADDTVTAGWKGSTVRQMKGVDIRFGGICSSCNSGWMHDLESEFRSVMLPALTGEAVLRGQALKLDRGAQRVIATWGVKTWFLLELATEYIRKSAVRSDTVLPFLYRHHCPPEEVQVFLGVAPAPWLTFSEFSTVGLPRGSEAPVAALALLTIGKLAFYFYVPSILGGQRQALAMELGGDMASALTQIWPHQDAEVGWPPAAVLSRELIDTVFNKDT
jgi:hypothetical protein